MDIELLWLGPGAFVLSALATGWVRRMALARGILDAPNERSSHTRATPRGGGLAIVGVSLVGLGVLYFRGRVDMSLLLALVGGGIPLAWIGFRDDRRSVSVGVRLLVHFLSAGWAVYMLGGLGPLQLGARVVDLGIAGDVLAISAVVWTVNLFNFMDGIDGIAGSEAAFVAFGGGALATVVFGAPGVMGVAAVFAGACLGFLAWNWPPAKIFMGDAGSGFLGFFIATLALASARAAPVAVFVWIILGGVFFVDATVTFARRLLRGARVHQAHREHAYQWLSRRWASHRATVFATILVNLCWLGPWAWYAANHPVLAAWVCLAALGPLVVLAVAAGAGRPE